MLGRSLTPWGPLASGGHKDDASFGPLSKAAGVGVAVVRGAGGRVKVRDERFGLWVDADLCRHRGGFHWHQLGKADALVHAGQAGALDPAMGAACAPGAVRLEMAPLVGEASSLASGWMPHRALSFAQPFVGREVFGGTTGIEVFGVLAEQGHAGLDDSGEGLRAPRERGALGPLVESKALVHGGLACQPAPLGFAAKEAALLHEAEEPDQGLRVRDKGMSPGGTGGGMLPKAFKPSTQQVDRVGTGRFDHSGASWKVLAMFSRRNLPLPTMSTDLCTPLSYVSQMSQMSQLPP
jgi:hypothetical protein